MVERRGLINDVPERLRVFAKAQRSMMTKAESVFWEQVRAGRFHGQKFKRQVPISPYIVDFLCVSARVVVEFDGPPHEAEDRRRRDAERDAWLRGQGFRVLRFTNDQVLGNCDLVMAAVRSELNDPSPASLCEAPSPSEGERVTRRPRQEPSPLQRERVAAQRPGEGP